MKLIVGLGNPGKEYENTRHNSGFCVMDAIAKECNVEINQKKFKALVAQTRIGKESVLLMKPQTYMNLSGEALIQAVNFYHIDIKDILVIYDDLDLPVGKIRLREKGSAGGHNGIKNIIANLGSSVFPRIKVGVGEKPKGYDLADYVLGKFSKEDRVLMEEGYDLACEASALIMQGAINQAMNEYNQKKKE